MASNSFSSSELSPFSSSSLLESCPAPSSSPAAALDLALFFLARAALAAALFALSVALAGAPFVAPLPSCSPAAAAPIKTNRD